MKILPEESILHYIWQHQYFEHALLQTSNGEAISIVRPGQRNHDEGPDFLNARIKIGTIEWAGSIEIHVRSSDWDTHNHTKHGAYQNVILHVVFEDDKIISRKDSTAIPALVLKNYVQSTLIERCRVLLHNKHIIPCQGSLASVNNVVRFSMLDRALGQRLQRKAHEVLELLAKNNGDWEETTYQLIARNFGFKVNAEPFFKLAQMLPFKVLLKHADNQLQIEALLFGQAGFLEVSNNDDYYLSLQKEYQYLSYKYSIGDKKLQVHEWKFLRLRPNNFPTIRLSQFANLIFTSKSLFSHITETENIESLKKLFDVSQSLYWKTHYLFGKKATKRVPGLGRQSFDNLLINAVCTLLAAFSLYKDQQEYTDRAVSLLEILPAEDNKITKAWKSLEIIAKNSFDSQALTELFNNFCTQKACLNCNIGHSVISGK